MDAKQFNRLLAKLGACEDARKFTKGKSLRECWATSERGDWMLWLCGKMVDQEGWPTRQEMVLAACACARMSLKFVPKGEDRPLQAIKTAEKWAKGKATLEEVQAAAIAAAAWAAAAHAACAADSTAAATAAAYAAAAAASTAAAYAAAAADSAAAAARAKALKKCAAIVRKRLVFPALKEATCTA